MGSLHKALMASGGSAAAPSLEIEDVFSAYVLAGDGTSTDVVNGIDLLGEGGLVWTKVRDTTYSHTLIDTERGVENYIQSDNTSAEGSGSTLVTAFNSDGHTGTFTATKSWATWTFRKAPRFFDVVTYTGNGANRDIAHNLGVAPGMIIVKNIDSAYDWQVYHKGNTANPETDYLVLNETDATADNLNRWNDTAPTDTQFTIGTGVEVNTDTDGYVAYLFADDPEGLIACDGFTTHASTGDATIDLGWEPQYVMFKPASTVGNWYIYDCIRGLVVGGNDQYLLANLSNAEVGTTNIIEPTSTGFHINVAFGNSVDIVFMAIRRPMRTPESADEVFAIDTRGSVEAGVAPGFRSGFVVDMALGTLPASTFRNMVATRLTQATELVTDATTAEVANTDFMFDYMNGYHNNGATLSNYQSWMWKRAKGFFDVVTYSGDSQAGREIEHNLTVTPEMMWVKVRSRVDSWAVYHTLGTGTKYLALNVDADWYTGASRWNDTDPTDSVFTVGNNEAVNYSGDDYVAYLFATLPGISKVGSYIGDGTTGRTIDCGFSAGASFILIKRVDVVSSGSWFVWDSLRGIIAGDDPYFVLDTTAAQVTGDDSVDPDSSGFIVNELAATHINVNEAEYIYYSIASI